MEDAADGATRVLVLPLYPQYSASTSASVFDAVAAWGRRVRRLPELLRTAQAVLAREMSFAPLRFNYAFPLKYVDDDELERFRFSVQTRF